MSSFLPLCLLSICMAVTSFFAGTLPLALHLSIRSVRVLELYGVGLLVGAALTVIIPEGIETVYAAGGDHPAENPSRAIGLALAAGFLFMLFIDQVGPGHSDGARNGTEASLAPSPGLKPSPPSSHLPLRLSRLEPSPAAVDQEAGDTLPTTRVRDEVRALNSSWSSSPSSPNSPHQHPTSLDELGGRATTPSPMKALSTMIGLIIHAAADGIALGASSSASDSSVLPIVFVALMIHKAPAALGLCSILMSTGLGRAEVRRAVIYFSICTPVSAIVTYILLMLAFRTADAGSPAEAIHSFYIGLALTCSGGTFLYVAMHALQRSDETLDDAISKGPRLATLFAGSLTPAILPAFLGQHHHGQ